MSREKSIDAYGDAQHDGLGAEIEPPIGLIAVQNANKLEDPVFISPLVNTHELAILVGGGRAEIHLAVVSGNQELVFA
jgi:hypothetical protein